MTRASPARETAETCTPSSAAEQRPHRQIRITGITQMRASAHRGAGRRSAVWAPGVTARAVSLAARLPRRRPRRRGRHRAIVKNAACPVRDHGDPRAIAAIPVCRHAIGDRRGAFQDRSASPSAAIDSMIQKAIRHTNGPTLQELNQAWLSRRVRGLGSGTRRKCRLPNRRVWLADWLAVADGQIRHFWAA
jgi:hypothetical protein